jgi:hypothetical protein
MFKYKGMSLQNPRLRKRLRRVPLTFTRASVAYDKYGNSVPVNTPRYGIAGGPNDGVLIEEEHTNLLTANQSTGTDTLGNTIGFGKFLGTDISSDSSTYIQGNKSLKVSLSGATANEGVNTGSIDVAGGKTYTQSVKIKIPKGSVLNIQIVERDSADVLIGATSETITGTGDFQDVSVTRAFGATGVKQRVYIISPVAAKFDFNVDTLQLTATAYPLSWTLGGTTMAAETLTVNSSVYDLTSGTIELEALANDIIKTDGINNYLLSTADGDGNNQISLLDDSSNNLTITTKASDAATSVSYADSNLTSNTMFKVAAPYKSDKLKLFKDGSSVGTPLTSANLPTTKQTIYLGSKYDGTLQANTLIRNVVLTKQDRVDGEITNRSYRDGFGVDKEVTLIAPLKNNLNAYRVATV